MAEKIGIRTATVTIKDGKVLLVNSKYGKEEYYLFPGGGVEFDETVTEGAVRETLEETGIKVKIGKLLHVNEFIYKNDWSKRSIAFFFLATPQEKFTKNISNDGGKIKQIKWVNISGLKDLDIRPKILADILINSSGKFESIPMEYSVDFKE